MISENPLVSNLKVGEKVVIRVPEAEFVPGVIERVTPDGYAVWVDQTWDIYGRARHRPRIVVPHGAIGEIFRGELR